MSTTESGRLRGLGGSLQPALVASFAVAFATRPCRCANPNYRTCGHGCVETGIRDFPRTGVLVYMWEFPSPRNPEDLGHGRVPAVIFWAARELISGTYYRSSYYDR